MANAQILVVEDESIIAKGIQNELTSLGYAVPALAVSGEEALVKAAETSPDLVLMDIVLKGNMDGVEASQHLRNRFNIPVVFLSAYDDEETLRRAKVTEPFGYLLKPYEERELHTTIEMALYKHRLEMRLKETERWLAATLRSIGNGVIVTDAFGTVRMVNPVAEGLTGWAEAEACDQPLTEVFQVVNERTGTDAVSGFTQALRKENAVRLAGSCRLVARGGSETPIEGSTAPIHDDQGVFVGFVVVFRDVTERRWAEEALRRDAEEARRAAQLTAEGAAGRSSEDAGQ
jgi:PAS domain S-box-containing protein